MNTAQWNAFSSFRETFKQRCNDWNNAYAAELQPLQRAAAQKDTPPYPLETAVVYNTALDELTSESRITYIVIGDNPGKDEQKKENQRYLVGQSGKLAHRFFSLHPELKTDFRRNVIILNKTPIHTAKTAHLRALAKQGGDRIRALIDETTHWMATETARLHQALSNAADADSPAPELWLVGYTELRERGLFVGYRDTLKSAYCDSHAGSCGQTAAAWQAVRVFRHFSMNQFSIELNKTLKADTPLQGAPNTGASLQSTPNTSTPLQSALTAIGIQHRTEIFG